MKKLLAMLVSLVLVSCGTEVVIVEPATPAPAPIILRPRPKKEVCSVAKEIQAISRQAVSKDEIFHQCLRLALENEPVCHELCKP